MSRRKLSWLLIIISLTLIFNLNLPAQVSAEQAAKTIVFKYCDPSRAGTSRTKSVEETLLEIEKKTGGAVKHERYWSESLLKVKDALKGLQAGTCDVGVPNIITYQPSRFPVWQFSQVLFAGGPDVYGVAKAHNELYEKNPILKKEFDDTGLQFLSVSPLTPSVFMSRVPLKDLKDFQGLKVRAIGPVGKWIASLGGSSSPLTFYEINEALSRKVIDAVQTYTYATVAYKFYENCKYMPAIGYSHTVLEVFINKDSLGKLPPEMQKIYVDTWRNFFVDRFVQHTDEEHQQQIDLLKKEGVDVYDLTPEQAAKWRESAKPIIELYLEDMKKRGVDGKKIVDEYQALYDKFERKKK